MKRTLTLFLSLLATLPILAQQETSRWFMHNNQVAISPGGNITNVSPNGISQQFNPTDFSTSVSDGNGNLLFASDGATIINRNYDVMPALVGIRLRYNSGNLMAIKAGPSSRYFLFYGYRENAGPNSPITLYYALIDLSLNGGLGDVIEYDKVIGTGLSEGFTVIKGLEPGSAWLVTHLFETDEFRTYPLTPRGFLQIYPFIVSKAGSNQTKEDYIFRTLKASPNGKMIAGYTYRDYTDNFPLTASFVEVFNFDPESGQLSSKVRSRRVLGYFRSYFSLEFSADNRLLYESTSNRLDGLPPCGFSSGEIIQYNLCYTDSLLFTKYKATVAINYTVCTPNASWGRIQMGPDKKIRVPYSGTILSAIRNPNIIGNFCDFSFQDHNLSMGNNQNIAGPAFYHAVLEKAIKNNITYSGGCYGETHRFSLTNDTLGSASWNFGDPGSVGNTQNGLSPQHRFSKPGIFTVTADVYGSSGQFLEKLTTLVEVKDPGRRLLYNFPKDTAICSGTVYKIGLSAVNGIFHWTRRNPEGFIDDSWVSDSAWIDRPGVYIVEMRQNDCDGCILTDSISVTILPIPNFSLGPDRAICNGDSLQLSVFNNEAQYEWSTGSTSNQITVRTAGTYWVEARLANCTATDTIKLFYRNPPSISLGRDTSLCEGQELILDGGLDSTSVKWLDGSSLPTYTVKQSGTYWAEWSRDGCTSADTIQVDYRPLPALSLGNDTAICNNQSLWLQPSGQSLSDFRWQDGSTSSSYFVTVAGLYHVMARGENGCWNADTIQINQQAIPALDLGADKGLCPGESITYNFSATDTRYKWQDGQESGTRIITNPGLYWIEGDLNGCTYRDSIILYAKPVPVISLGSDTIICDQAILVLDASYPGATTTWNTGSQAPQLQVRQAGQYIAQLNLDGCTTTDSIRVSIKYPPAVELGPDRILCTGTSLVLNAGNSDATLSWQDGSSAPAYTVNKEGIYRLKAENECGSDTDEIKISQALCDLKMPTAFTPNGDGRNDLFRVVYPQSLEAIELTVYNRFGMMVFRTQDPKQGWDGRLNGIQQPEGTYIWTIQYTDIFSHTGMEKGVLVLAR